MAHAWNARTQEAKKKGCELEGSLDYVVRPWKREEGREGRGSKGMKGGRERRNKANENQYKTEIQHS
jgi:hypothetical protein